jgi:hypothetical protein
VLDGLGYHLDHQPVTVIWDNLGAHHAGDLEDWVATQPWLALAYLPSYAPELNPVEELWASLKGCELANRCCADRGVDRHRPGRLDADALRRVMPCLDRREVAHLLRRCRGRTLPRD